MALGAERPGGVEEGLEALIGYPGTVTRVAEGLA